MITFAAPGFLLAGAILAVVPIVLHLLARTTPERRPLPTARFLTVDRRTQLRVRRPSDLLLLALRVMFIVLLGAAFADPEWLPARTGAGVVVLLDGGAGMAPVWDEAVAAARGGLGPDGTLVVFDSVARVAADPERALDSLATAGPGAGAASYLAALRGLKAAAGALPAESATAVLVTRPRWSAWSPGVAMAREAAWRARIEVVALEAPSPRVDRMEEQADGRSPGMDGGSADVEGGGPGVEGATEPGEAMAWVVLGAEDHPLRPYAAAALGALGYAPASDTLAGLVLVLPDADDATPRAIPEAPRVVLLGGRMEGGWERGGRPWISSREAPGGPARSRGRLVLPDGRAIEGWVPQGGRPAAGSVVVAVWEDGRPAAAATRRGDGCHAYLAAEPGTSAAAADPAFPWLIRALADACAAGGVADGRERSAPADEAALAEARGGVLPLDRGATVVLRGDALPPAVDLLSAEGPRRRALAGLLTVLALVVALAEAAIAYRGRGAPG